MHALDLGDVERPGGIADEQGSRHVHAWQRLEAALDDRAGPGRNDLAAFEQRRDFRMMLELLEGLERRETRVLIIEPDHVADVQPVLVEVIEKAAAVGLVVHGPAHRVLDQAGGGASGGELPQLLEAEAVGLWGRVPVETEARDHLLGQAAAAALREDRRAGVDIHAGGEVGARTAVGRVVRFDAHVPAPHPDDARLGAFARDEHAASREPRKHLDAERFGMRGQLLAEFAQRDDEVAGVVHLRGRGQAEGALPREQAELVPPGRDADRRGCIAPRRHQLVERLRLHDAPR